MTIKRVEIKQDESVDGIFHADVVPGFRWTLQPQGVPDPVTQTVPYEQPYADFDVQPGVPHVVSCTLVDTRDGSALAPAVIDSFTWPSVTLSKPVRIRMAA